MVERVVTADQPATAAPDGHDATMADKFENQDQAPVQGGTPQMPEGGDPKFWNAEAGVYNWEAAYKDMSFRQAQSANDKAKAQGIPQDADKEPATQTQSEGDDNGLGIKEPSADDAAKDGTLDLTVYTQEYMETGELSEESITEVTKVIPREYVDQYIAGFEATRNNIKSEVHSVAGGEEQYGDLMQWAGENLEADEIEAFNAVAHSGNMPAFKMQVEALLARRNADEGTPAQRTITGDSAGTGTGGDVYESWEQVRSDMARPEYERDPAFRDKVTKKLGRSQL